MEMYELKANGGAGSIAIVPDAKSIVVKFEAVMEAVTLLRQSRQLVAPTATFVDVSERNLLMRGHLVCSTHRVRGPLAAWFMMHQTLEGIELIPRFRMTDEQLELTATHVALALLHFLDASLGNPAAERRAEEELQQAQMLNLKF